MAQGRRRRDRRHIAAAHQICAGRVLHRCPGGSLVQSRPLRRRALRAAGSRPRRDRDVRAHACRRLRQGSAPAHHDRNLRPFRRLLRRLLPARAAGADADQARFRGVLCWRHRRGSHTDDAVRGICHRRKGPCRSGRNVPQRCVHGDGEPRGPAGHFRARAGSMPRVFRSACSSSAGRSPRRRCSRLAP